MNNKKFIYFPSFSSKLSILAKDDLKISDDIPTFRFWDDRFPEKFRHKYFLITAPMFFRRKTSIIEEAGLQDCMIFADSGGFQVANGTIQWDLSIREDIFNFLENNSTLAMNLDIPPKINYKGKFRECIDISYDNIKYFHEKQSGKTKFLNVLQMDEAEEQFDIWYDKIKMFEFNGWGIGGTLNQHYNAIYIIALLLKNRELDKKLCEYIHFLGATNPFNFLIYAVIQKNLNKYYPHCTVTTDSSTPLLQPVYGNWAHSINYKNWNFNYLWVGNKGTVKYEEEAKLPCILEDCPICSNINFGKIAEYTGKGHSTNFTLHVGYHNFFIFLKSVDWISNLVDSGNDVLKGFFTMDILTMIRSIDEMFEKPEDAMRIFYKHKRLYVKLSNQVEKMPDKNLVANEELFA